MEFTEKQLKIIGYLVEGHFIVSTNGLTVCNGVHITGKSLRQLIRVGVIVHESYIGSHTVRFKLKDEIAERLISKYINAWLSLRRT
jgi:hypothetical protein